MIDKKTRELLKDGVFPFEVAKEIDELGYSFLDSQGFKTKSVRTSDEARKDLSKEIESRGLIFKRNQRVTRQKMVVFFFLEDATTHEIKAKSKGVEYYGTSKSKA